MNSSVGSEIVTGFIGEVEGYLPDMSRCLQTLQQDRAHRPSLAELHRITHTIKGAAAMVGLDDLSGVGEILEKVMENVLGASLVLDDETILLLGDATHCIDSYCTMQRAGQPDDRLFQKTVARIEEKLCQCTDGSGTGENNTEQSSTEQSNPEAILYDQEEEDLLETVPDDVKGVKSVQDFPEDDAVDFFVEADSEISKEPDSERLLDDISVSDLLAGEDVEDELLFQEVEDLEEEDDLFGSVVTEYTEQSETVEDAAALPESTEMDQDDVAGEAIDPELLQCFQEETEDHLENIDSCLISLDSQISESVALTPSTQETLHSLRRSVHTLKGAAAVIGIEPVAAWGHDFEDFLDWLHDEAQQLDPITVAALREGADLLASLAEEPALQAEQERQRILGKFADITKAFSSGLLGDEQDEENVLEPSQNGASDSFPAADTEEVSEEAGGLFDDLDLASSASPAEDVEDELLFQEVEDLEEEDDLFGSVVTEHTEQSETVEDAAALPESTEMDQDDVAGEAIDPELLQCFQEETEDHLENIDSCLISLDSQISESVALTPSTQETLHSLRRSVHTLKGAAAVIGIEPVAAWGHDFEDFLDWLHDEAQRLDPITLVALREGADLLASLAEEPALQTEQERQRIIGNFADITEAFSSGLTVSEDDDETVNALELPEDRGADDFFTETDSEGGDKAGPESLFNELSLSDSSAGLELEDDELLLQDVEEDEDDFFGSVVAGLSASPEDIFTERAETGQGEAGAEATDPELLECFREETEEHLENIDSCLNRLGVQITAPVELTSTTRETLHSLRRSVHTLKGAAAVIGIEPVAAWGHDFEDFLDWLHDESQRLDPSLISLLRDGADLLAKLAEDPAYSVEKRKSDLTGQFYAVIEGDASAEDTSLFEAQEDIVDQDFFPEENLAAKENTLEESQAGENADNFFDELPVPPADEGENDPLELDPESAFASLPELSESVHKLSGGEEIDEELLQCFHEEAEEHLDNIDRQLNHLGMTVSGEAELTDLKRGSLHSIRRSVHTLKGAAAVIGIDQIAAWGHDFEDFLDWLHDEARGIRPQVVEAMQEGADILVRLVEKPNQSLRADQQHILKKFGAITAGDLGESPAHNREEETAADAGLSAFAEPVVEQKVKTAPRQQRQLKKTITLRVDVNRIDQMVGLSGDMVINLSSFEDSMEAMSGTMKELDMILQRLKNINSSLEAGYELASIPHLGGPDDGQSSGLTEDFDPLEMDRYSELNILIRSLSEAVSDLDSIMAQNVLDNVTWQKTVERQGMVLKELQNRMMGVRMTPLLALSNRMHRTVREAERTTGHPARLTIEGESIMMDTRVWDIMADPLMHILRNAVAHGGRLPQKAGWQALSITIKAIRKGGLCILRVSDNGTGLDYEAIRVKGMKLYPNDRVNLMSDSELAELIFRHGFSSTGSITNIAGRGVGMDVVRDAIDQLNGSIELISERGQGTEFIMRLPVAVAQLPAILARLGTQIYAIPMHDVASVARVTPEEKKGSEYTFDGETMPLLHLAKVPGFETGSGYVEESLSEEDQALLIVHTGRKRAALFCEQLIGQRDVVFKDLGTHLKNVPCISGVTIMGDGALIPILQVEEVLHKWSSVVQRQDERSAVRSVQERGPLHILVVDDSISVRKVVSNFITQQGWIPVAARNGIEAVEKVREEKPDVILLDVEMPRMNGFEVLQALQAQPEYRDIPVAMLTSRSADKYQEKARELGARGFMTKPFKADEVIRFIRKETANEQV
ncbi:MAG: Hpt domain-containing protein [Candidatus Electrothrix sp. GW3-4]|uniref:hybrid sensor histidine kinase/response regulator n=1 Tax=Candidatus Electrothrix sp. GW3-4 TaxID=3126740 RepID=UPI0030D21AD0